MTNPQTLHPTQSKVAQSKARFRVVNCGRQWGKTTLSMWEAYALAFSASGKRIGYFATTFGQARDIAWTILKEMTRPVWSRTPNETRLELFIKTQDGGESEIVLRGWESVEANRGTQFDLLILDEVAKMRNFKEGWQAVLLATLAFRQGGALFISTPYGFNHFHELYNTNSSDFESFTFTSYDNPHLDRDYLEMVRGTVTPDFWAQEYLAEFRRFTGLIYKEFDMVKHVHDFPHEFNDRGKYLFGLDFAVRGNTASSPIKETEDGHFYIFDEYKEENLTAQEHGQSIRTMLTRYADMEKYTGYADPAGWMKNQQKGELIWSIADEYIDMGFPIVKGNNEVAAGINFVRQLFMEDRIHIHPRCTKTIDELLMYQWRVQPDSQVGEQSPREEPRKIHDHLLDEIRYALYSKPTPPKPEQPKLPYKAGMLLEFPHWATTPTHEQKTEDSDKFTPL